MKAIALFIYSVLSYLFAFASIIYWILSVSNLIPEISIDGIPTVPISQAILTNVLLITILGLQHSIMARKSFKKFITRFIPEAMERSTFVLMSGATLTMLVYYWQPVGGIIWSFESGSFAFYTMYALFLGGWAIMFISSFLINHFDLFGLRQGYLTLVGKPYTPLQFKVWSLYKYTRHPLYFGCILGVWATPHMTVTHLFFAILITTYFVIGALFEEKDLIRDFGDKYRHYMGKTSMIIPFLRIK
jgi:protein-S-isoprenylcysteine O-methyltransferase Ste14